MDTYKHKSRKRTNDDSSHESRSVAVCSKKRKKSKKRVKSKKKANKHKKRSSTSESSSESSSVTGSSSSSSESSIEKRKKKHRHKKKKKHEKKKLFEKWKKIKQEEEKQTAAKSEIAGKKVSDSDEMIGPSLEEARKSMAPMTKEDWDKQQSVIRRVHDPETGRNRLIKGDGEVLEEIVSKERHKEINKAATYNDGESFKKKMGLL